MSPIEMVKVKKETANNVIDTLTVSLLSAGRGDVINKKCVLRILNEYSDRHLLREQR